MFCDSKYFKLPLLVVAVSLCLAPVNPLRVLLSLSIIGFLFTDYLIQNLRDQFIKIGFTGKDMNKPGHPVLPESMGAIVAAVYVLILICFVPFAFYHYIVISAGGGIRNSIKEISLSSTNESHFPNSRLAEYLSIVISLETTALLGIADDLFDLRWRHKFFLPAFFAIPILIVYYVDFSVTYVVVPKFLQFYFGELVDLGVLYYVYMLALVIFCTNSINIMAGVNGLEVGQSIVMGVFIMINDLLYLSPTNHPARESHLVSIYFVAPFLCCALALLKNNWYPARVFVGDTFCYLAGMVFASVGISAHFSKTLLLLFIPQIFNFLFSIPQLFNIVPCPRHRLPRLIEGTDKVNYSTVALPEKLSWPAATIISICSKLNLVKVTYNEKTKLPSSVSNFTLMCILLVNFGPMREDQLTLLIMLIQTVCCSVGLSSRHFLAKYIFHHDNLVKFL